MNRYAKYRALMTLAETGNFSRAAEAMGLSQPALSRSIQALESAIGADLVIRGQPRIELTALGERVVERARRILNKVDDLDEQVRRLAALEIGQIRFGAGPFPTVAMAAEVLSSMAVRFPGLNMSFEMEGWQLITQRLKEGMLDMVVTDSVDAEKDQELQVRRLKNRSMLLAARAGHPLAERGELKVSDLGAHSIVTTSLPPRVETELSRLLGRCWRPKLQCDDVSMLVDYVQLTDSLTFLPQLLIDAEPNLVRLSFQGSLPDTSWGIIRLANRSLSPAAQVLMETINTVDRNLDRDLS